MAFLGFIQAFMGYNSGLYSDSMSAGLTGLGEQGAQCLWDSQVFYELQGFKDVCCGLGFRVSGLGI